MFVLALRIELRFPSARSLKHKRASLKPIVDGLRSRFGVSVAEVGHHDTWQRCQLGVALVSGDVHTVEQVADDIERFVWRSADTEILDIERLWLETDR